DITVTAKVNNNAADTGKSATVAFTADVTTAIVTSLTPDITTAQADNMTPVTFTATVKDSSGHLAPNTDISFTTTDGTLSQTTAITNANGEATVSLTSATIGDITVTAKVNNNAADTGKSATVAFTADVTAVIVTDIEPEFPTAAIGFNFISITATVKDSSGHFVENANVRFDTTHGNISPQQIVTTDVNGQATVNLSGSTPGNAIVTAKVDSNPNDIGRSTTVTFVPEIVRTIPNPE
ncbi:Ig-like domain-containing protein, partial [Pectobacterium parvum]